MWNTIMTNIQYNDSAISNTNVYLQAEISNDNNLGYYQSGINDVKEIMTWQWHAMS